LESTLKSSARPAVNLEAESSVPGDDRSGDLGDGHSGRTLFWWRHQIAFDGRAPSGATWL